MYKYYYFGYGANLCHDLMIGRRPDSVFLEAAFLNDYTLSFDTVHNRPDAAVANIIADEHGRVWGGLYEISPAGLKSLDIQECYPHDYQRRWVTIHSSSGALIRALVYLRPPGQRGLPTTEYLDIIRHGMDDCQLPENYKESVVSLATHQLPLSEKYRKPIIV